MKIKLCIEARVTYSAADWGLYKPTTKEARVVAKTLNLHLERLLRTEKTESAVVAKMVKVLARREFAKFSCGDTFVRELVHGAMEQVRRAAIEYFRMTHAVTSGMYEGFMLNVVRKP